jgi:hypothetical protein
MEVITMSWKSHWLSPVLAFVLLTPDLGLARQGAAHHESVASGQLGSPPAPAHSAARAYESWRAYDGPRIGLSHADLGLSAARGSRDFNGLDTRNANLYAFHSQVHLSLLAMTLGSWGVFESNNRLRIGDYWRGEFILGWMMEEQSDVVPGGEADLTGGDGVLAGIFAAGLQANYLVSDILEVGGVVAKATWNTTMGFGNANHGALKPTDEPYPLLWIGRVRYGSLFGEYHTAATAKFQADLTGHGPGDKFQYHHSYSSLKLRYFKRGGNSNLGVDLDRYGYHIDRTTIPNTSSYATNRSVTSIRLSFGFSH